MKKERKCDLCGKEITGEGYGVYNEKYQLQKGVLSCGCQYDSIGESENIEEPIGITELRDSFDIDETKEVIKIGTKYNVQWMPTKYLYEHTGVLLKNEPKTLIFDVNGEDTIRVQKKFIESIMSF